MTLDELIDLEARLALDAHVSDEALHARDRAIATGHTLPGDREARLVAWTRALRPTDRMSAGMRVRATLTALRSGLSALGLLLGAAAASAALFYDGRHPVNVAHFVFALVLPQAALVLVTSLVLGVRALRMHETENVAPLMRQLVRRLSTRMTTSQTTRDELAALWGRIDARRGLSAGIEGHTLLGVLQLFGVAFNLGALGACLVRVAFTDVSFAWSSTLIAWDGTMSRLVHALSTPWASVWPDASPTRALVRATRYYHGGALPDPVVAGRWWPFLVASLLVYGLVPRVVLLTVTGVQRRRALARVPLDTPDVDAVLRRLAAPLVTFPRHAPLGPLPVAEHVEATDDGREPKRFVPIAWRGFPIEDAVLRDAVANALGGTLAAPMTLGGPDHAATERTLTTLPDVLRDTDAVLLLCEAFEPPDRGLRKMLARVRATIGARRTLLVGLVDRVRDDGVLEAATSEAVQSWRRTLDALGDPYLRVEPIAKARAA